MANSDNSGNAPPPPPPFGEEEPRTGREIAEARRGTVVAKRYRVEELLTFGGMGAFYRARDLEVGRPCALRVLPETYTREPEIMNRFMREARAATEIGHPNIIEVFDIGVLEDESVFSVMELLDGQSLADVIAYEAPISASRAVHIVAQVCRALGTAHESSIIHRDLKPENIVLITHDGDLDFVKVVDFGICKHVEDDVTTSSEGMLIGSPDYMAPEQAAGSEATAASDIYALGCILFQVLTGKLPYTGRTGIEVLVNKGEKDAPRLTDYRAELPSELADVVASCLARQPGARPESMRVLEYELMRSTDTRHANASTSGQVAKEPSLTTPIASAVSRAPIPAPPMSPAIAAAEQKREEQLREASGNTARPEPSGTQKAPPEKPEKPPEKPKVETQPTPVVVAEESEELPPQSGSKTLTLVLLGAVAVAVVLYAVKPELFGKSANPQPQNPVAQQDPGKGPPQNPDPTAESNDSNDAGDSNNSTTADDPPTTGAPDPTTGADEGPDIDVLIGRAELALKQQQFLKPEGRSFADYFAQLKAANPEHEAIARIAGEAQKPITQAANLALEEQRWNDAVRLFRTLGSFGEDELKRVRKSYVQALLQEGRMHRALGNFDQSLANADEAIKVSPKSGEAHMLRGEALGKLARWHEAVSAFKTAGDHGKSREARGPLKEARQQAKSQPKPG